MENTEFIKKMAAGIFLVAGCILILMFVITLGKNKGLSKDKFQMSVLYRNVGGLMVGAPIRLAGVNVGNVADIAFLEQNIEGRQVQVTLNVFNEYKKQFQQGLKFAIRTEGVLGSKVIEIYPVEGAPPVNISQPILGQDPLDVQDFASEFANAAAAFTKTAEEMGNIDMLELSEVMIASSKALLETSRGINDIMEELQEMSIKSKRIFDRIEEKVINDELFKVF